MSDEWQNRMESKIDKLVEAILLMSHLQPAITTLEERVEKVEESVHDLQVKMPLIDLVLKGLGRAAYVAIGLVVVGIFGWNFVI
jgi:hypothetical protein